MIRPTLLVATIAWASLAPVAHAQLAPEIGYVHPAGGQAGTTVDVVLGGYNWTPDMQLFVHDPRITIELLGPPSPVLVPEPPYWFGAKGRGYAWPLPREFAARLTIPTDVSPGIVRWQAANANGASPAGAFFVGSAPQVVEGPQRAAPQALPALPVTVCGQILKIEEIDRYAFVATQTGPVTVELLARRLGSPLHGMLKIQDGQGAVIVDVADTEGQDLTLTMQAVAGEKYILSLHDLDFAGDRSYVYRLTLTPGGQARAAYPAAGKRGETRAVEFVGLGLATGAAQLETVTCEVAFPAAAETTSFTFRPVTPLGLAQPFTLLVSDALEQVEPAASDRLSISQLPAAVTGSIESRFGADRYTVELHKDESWRIAAQASALGSPLDLELTVIGPDGKEIAANDDAPGSTDPLLTLAAPADGAYEIVVGDRSGKSGDRSANYRLTIEPAAENFSATVPEQLGVPLGGQVKLAIPIVRAGGFKGPVVLSLSGLPEGVTPPADLTIAEDKNDLTIELPCAADAPASAAMCAVSATATLNGQQVTRRLGTILLATVMKPRCKITPEGLDDVRKVHRGTTYLAPLLIERLEGYQGEIVLEMTAKQQRHRQGLASEEMVVPADATRVEYPIFVPEWMETTKTSRMILNGVVKMADPRGAVRTLVNQMELRIGILPEGALLKLSHAGDDATASPAGEAHIPLTLSRAAELSEPVRIDLVPSDSQTGLISAEPMTLSAEQTEATLVARFTDDASVCGEQPLLIRATALQDGRWSVISETTVLVSVRRAN